MVAHMTWTGSLVTCSLSSTMPPILNNMEVIEECNLQFWLNSLDPNQITALLAGHNIANEITAVIVPVCLWWPCWLPYWWNVLSVLCLLVHLDSTGWSESSSSFALDQKHKDWPIPPKPPWSPLLVGVLCTWLMPTGNSNVLIKVMISMMTVERFCMIIA